MNAPKKVFLVEDNALLARTLSATLEAIDGLELAAQANSEEAAVRLLRAAPNSFHLIVIDIFLTSGSGLGVLRAARKLQPRARIVMLTNYATMDVRRSCVRLGAERVFDKSRQLDEFLDYCGRVAGGDGATAPEHDDGPATVPMG